MELLQELFKLRERQIIDAGDVDAVVDNFKFAISHIKSKISPNLDFDELVLILQSELKLTRKEAAVITNLFKKK